MMTIMNLTIVPPIGRSHRSKGSSFIGPRRRLAKFYGVGDILEIYLANKRDNEW